MGLFQDILGKIFHHAAPAETPAASTAQAAPAGTAAPSGDAQVDVAAVLSQMPNNQSLNWRTSIVDLLKLLGLDSSLASRKQLAQELGYAGDTNDSASMNIWLHKQVMAKLAANGGKVPAELLA